MNENQKLPLFGIGPYLVAGLVLVDALFIILFRYVFKIGTVDGFGAVLFRVVGGILIVAGLIIWFIGAVKSDMDKSITQNKLQTGGIYAWVRNPMYSGWWILAMGVSFMWHNIFLVPAQFLNWLIMAIVLKNTEEKWLSALYGKDYEDYRKKVNRCIPWKWNNRHAKIVGAVVGIVIMILFVLCVASAPRGKTEPTEMTFHEFGTQNKKIILLIHPSIVMWDYFEYVIPLLENDFHVIVPALPGYDKERHQSNFTSVEQIAAGIEDWLLQNGYDCVDALYGCSMGGAIVLRLLADQQIQIKNAFVDGGITPYKAPWIFTRFIALKDWTMMYLGKAGGIKLLEKVFATDEYTDEDLLYVADVFSFISARTIWNTFDSCNNYKMPSPIPEYSGHLEYWYADSEATERKKDFAYINENFPTAEFIEMQQLGHAGMATFRPEEFARRISDVLE